MSTLAEQLRERNRAIVEALSIDERLALAFKLGEDDLESYRASQGLSRTEALARLRRQKQRGRRPCQCLLETEP